MDYWRARYREGVKGHIWTGRQAPDGTRRHAAAAAAEIATANFNV